MDKRNCFFVAVLVSLGSLAPGADAKPQGAISAGGVSEEMLQQLGFSPATTTIQPGDYVQLLVRVHVVGTEGTVTFDSCPRGSIWGFDLRNITRGNTTTELGVKVDLPDGLPSATFTPLTLSSASSGFFGGARDCSSMVKEVLYRSPKYYVAGELQRQFAVTPVFATSAYLDPEMQSHLTKVLSAASVAAGVPAAAAAPYLATVGKELGDAKARQSQGWTKYFEVAVGPVQPVQSWLVPPSLAGADQDGPARAIVVLAQLVPAAPVVSVDLEGRSVTPSAVLNSNFDIPLGPQFRNQSLEDYVFLTAYDEVTAYGSAESLEAANLACQSLGQKIRGIGMSPRDEALTLWAFAQRRVQQGKDSRAVVDNMNCLSPYWPALTAAGLVQTNVALPAAPATTDQMKFAIEVGDALEHFFMLPTWEARRPLAERLFEYPLSYSQAGASMLRDATSSVQSTDGWVANAFERDEPLLDAFRCFAYFDQATEHSFEDWDGASFMVGFGATPPRNDRPASDVAVLLGFAPVRQGQVARIDRMVVQESLSPENRSVVLAAVGNTPGCVGEQTPSLLSAQ